MTSYTTAQAKALHYAFKKNGALYAPGTRMGGAFRRCCEALVEKGLLNGSPPFAITMKGLHALRDIREKRYQQHACIAYQDDLKEVEAALAEFPRLARMAAA